MIGCEAVQIGCHGGSSITQECGCRLDGVETRQARLSLIMGRGSGGGAELEAIVGREWVEERRVDAR